MDRLVSYIIQDDFPRPSYCIMEENSAHWHECLDEQQLERFGVGGYNKRVEWFTYDNTGIGADGGF